MKFRDTIKNLLITSRTSWKGRRTNSRKKRKLKRRSEKLKKNKLKKKCHSNNLMSRLRLKNRSKKEMKQLSSLKSWVRKRRSFLTLCQIRSQLMTSRRRKR